MSLKLEIETWVAALARYDNNEFDDALGEFDRIADTSKILFNMGVIHATLGEHEKAVECYQRAIRLDQYLAVAYFQQGVSNFLLGDFEEALANFNDTLLYLRGNTMIDYAQLGLLFKLYSCEVLFNRGLCYIYLQQREAGMQDLSYAVKEKVVEDHNVIDEAIREEAEGYTVFSIPVGVVYRPNEAKVRNLKTKDYLGKARLVAASDRSNAFTGFTGSEIKNAGQNEVKDDRPADNISFAATNLVKPGIQSRRQQSEPPTSRNVFPPTPPPENDRPNRGSVRNGSRPTPAKLTIQTQDIGRKYEKAPSPEEIRATRSASSSVSRGFSRRDLPPMQRRPTRPIEEEDEADPADLYDMYQGRGGESSMSRDSRPSTRSRQQPRYPEEDDGSDYDGSLGGAEFEMVSNNRRRQGSRSDSRAASRRPEIRKIRVKVHADDVRYLMIGTAIEFQDLVDRIKDKFGLRRRFKIKIKDEDMPDGDMITIGDEDDLEMAIQSATNQARRQRLEVAKMEIWIFDL
ncbi:tetratricopeptide domain protein [Metarhizium robertsii]|uniref:NADPH oxidase regulator NoxR n=2 Tax=Metarhizium robertsii TaxID=568076 RepID=E9ER46_METRA|nr:NADPH oxidase regulator NoxR [Metarhizium robertsii ARSEF 23]EFZ02913.1 NADPH oxidase regulator NoxR [Metarhizium robertsii ARSEF 23]EXV06168.1 tetratricopeptide domain protein [Metarhizium robertsii]